MEEARNLVYRIRAIADTQQAQAQIQSLVSGLGGNGGAGSRIRINTDTSQARSDLQRLTGDIGSVGARAETLGSAFRRSFLQATDSGRSFSQSLRSGVSGAFDHASERATEFGLRTLGGLQQISQGLRNPVQTIRNGFGNALQSVQGRFTRMVRGANDATEAINRMGNAAGNAQGDVRSLGGAAEASGSKFSALGLALPGVGVAAAAAGAAMVGFAASSVSVGMDFDKAMSQVAATMGKSVKDLQSEVGSVDTTFGHFEGNLREYAQFMGSNTAFSATEAVNALNYMALAGYDTEKSMSMLPTVLNLAAAGNMELAAASDMVTDAASALGLSTEQTVGMVDQMAMASSKTNTSVEQLGSAMLQVGGTAKVMAGGTQEIASVLGVLADNGIKGAEGGTHLRNMLLKLSKPTKDSADALEKLGVSVFDAEGKMRAFPDIFGEMNSSLSQLTDEERLQTITKIFDSYDIAAVNALLGTSKDRWNELDMAIGNAAGAADKMSKTQLDNLEGDVTLFKSALEGVQIALADQLMPALRGVTQFGGEALSALTAGLKEDGVAGALSALGQVVNKAFSSAMESMPGIAEAGMSILQKLASGFAEGLPVVTAQLPLVLASVFDFLAENSPAMAEQGGELLTMLGTGIINAIPALLSNLPALIESIVGYIRAEAPALIQTGVELVLHLAGGILNALPDVVVAIVQIGGALLDAAMNIPGLLVDVGIAIVKGLWTGISETGSWLIGQFTGFLGGIVDSAKSFLGIASPSKVFAEIGDNMALGIGEGFSSTIGGVIDFITGLLPTDLNLPDISLPDIGDVFDGLASIGMAPLEAVATLFEDLTGIDLPDLGTFFDGVTAAVDELTSIDLVSVGGDLLQDLADGITNGLPILLEVMFPIPTLLYEFFAGSGEGMLQQGLQFMTSLGEGILNGLPTLMEFVFPIPFLIYEFFTGQSPTFMGIGLDTMVAMAQGVAGGIGQVLSAVAELASGILSTLASLPGEMAGIGANIVQGVWQGISSAGGWLTSQVSGFFSNIVSNVKSTLGIASPSKVFAEIGDNMALGVGKGFGDSIGGVTEGIEKSIPTELNLPRMNYEISPVIEQPQMDSLGDLLGLDIPKADKLKAQERQLDDLFSQGLALDASSLPDLVYNVVPEIADLIMPKDDLPDESFKVIPDIMDVLLPEVPDVDFDVTPIMGDFKLPDFKGIFGGVKEMASNVLGDFIGPVVSEISGPAMDTSVSGIMEAVLPSTGSNGDAGQGQQQATPFAPNISITVNGDVSEKAVEDMRTSLYDTVKELFEEFREMEFERMALKNQYSFR